MLTKKQRDFCKHVVAGKSAKDAYIASYNTKAKDTTIYAEATRLLAKDDIQDCIKSLQKPLENKAISIALSEREKKRAWLWDMITHAEKDSDKIAAMNLLNKMDNEYLNVNVNVQDNKTAIEKLDTNTLVELAGGSTASPTAATTTTAGH